MICEFCKAFDGEQYSFSRCCGTFEVKSICCRICYEKGLLHTYHSEDYHFPIDII